MSQSIIKIYWDNIYLHLVLDEEPQYTYYVRNQKNKYVLRVENHEVIVPIVNLEETLLLNNGKYYFTYEKDGLEDFLTISPTCGYTLDTLDKIYRYGAEKYAYIINFGIKERSAIKILSENDSEEMIPYMHVSYMMLNKHNSRRNILMESRNIFQLTRKAIIIVIKKIIQCLYWILSACRRKDGLHILFMSETRVPISGNLKALDDRMKERGLDQEYKISYSFSKTLQQSKLKTLFTWSRLLWLISKQDYIFVDDYVPIFKTIHLRKETKLIQVWHAGVGFKSVGYSRFGKAGSPHPIDSCHRHYDYALVGAPGLIHVYEEVFGIGYDHFLPYGLPRLDGYMDEEKIQSYRQQFYTQYPQFKDKKIVMFAPTYRGTGQANAYYPMDKIDFDKLYHTLKDEYIFMFKMHPFIVEPIDIPREYQDKIIDFSKGYDINELFYVTDVLITDFSSNIYEFALQRKPIIFYAFDKDFYQLTRGVHKTLDEACGNVCESFDEVLQVLEKHTFEMDKLDAFIEESFPKNIKNSSDEIIKAVLGKRYDE